MAQHITVKIAGIAQNITKRISGQINLLALSTARALAVFGQTFLGNGAGFSFSVDGSKSQLAMRDVKPVQGRNEEQKVKAVKKNQKEIAMLVGMQVTAIQNEAASFRSRIMHEKSSVAITLNNESLTSISPKEKIQEWGKKVANVANSSTTTMML